MSRYFCKSVARTCYQSLFNRASHYTLDPTWRADINWRANARRLYRSGGPNRPLTRKPYDKDGKIEKKTATSLQKRNDGTEKQTSAPLEKRDQKIEKQTSLEKRIPEGSELHEILHELREIEQEMKRLDDEFDSFFTVESVKKLAEEGSESENVSEDSEDSYSSSEDSSDVSSKETNYASSDYSTSEESDSDSEDTSFRNHNRKFDKDDRKFKK